MLASIKHVGLAAMALLLTSTAMAGDVLLTKPFLRQFGLTRGWYGQAQVAYEQYPVADAVYHSGELFVLSQAGSLTCFNAVTGEQRWMIRVGDPRNPYLPLGVGDSAVAVVNGSHLYLIGRKDTRIVMEKDREFLTAAESAAKKGIPKIVEYKTIPRVGKVIMEFKTKYIPSGPPAITADRVFVPNMSGLIDVYDMTPGKEGKFYCAIQADGMVAGGPVAAGAQCAWLSSKGTIGVTASEIAGPRESVAYNFRMRGFGEVSPTARGTSIFAGTSIGEIGHFSAKLSEPIWTTSVGAKLRTSPIPIGPAVYLTTMDYRLFKLNAADGRELWQTAGIRQFVAQSSTKVYVIDEVKRLAILDLNSGAILRTIAIPGDKRVLANPHSDQVFLVSDHGLVEEIHESALLTRLDYTHQDLANSEKLDPKKAKPGQPVDPMAPGTAPADPFAPAAPGGNAPADPFGPPPANPAAPAADPFAPAPAEGGAMPAAPAAADPFGPPAAGGAMPADPFAK
jgi:outer membrane protein assembly factor BamB